MKTLNAWRLVIAAGVLLFAACSGDSPTGGEPAETVTQSITLPNVFADASTSHTEEMTGSGSRRASAMAVVEIRKIRVTVYEDPGTKVLFQNTYDVDPTADSWTLPFTAPLGARVRLVTELMSVTNGTPTVEYSGKAGPLTMTACNAGCTPIPVDVYPGPVDNLGATSVTLTPSTGSVEVAGAIQLTGAASPAGPSYVGSWYTLDPGVATVSSTGSVTGVSAGTARIVYAVAAVSDTAVITVAATCVTKAYAFGTTVNGAWTNGDCLAASGSGRRFDMYEFTLTQQTSFRAQVTGPAGRRVSLRRAGTQDYLQVMASEEFMPSTSNPLEVRYILPAGTYVFEIANPDAGTLGNYTLATSMDVSQACSPVIFTTFGVTITDQLTTSDCAGIFAGREDRFIMLPDSGRRVDLTVTSSAIAPVLVFRDDRLGPASPTLSSDIRYTVGQTARTSYTTTFAGFTEIVVNNATAALGAYTLTIGGGATPTSTCVETPTSIGGKITAVWESTDCRVSSTNDVYDRYTFTLTSQTPVRIVETSIVAPKIVGIFTAGGTEVLEYVRATGDFDATWYLSPGQYEIRNTQAASVIGSTYGLETTVGSASIGCTNNATTGNVSFTGQTLAAGDCTFDSRFEDRLPLFVEAGKEIVLDMTSTGFAPAAIIRDPGSTPGTYFVRARRDNAGNVTATWRAATTGYYQVIFSTDAANASGSYAGSVIVR